MSLNSLERRCVTLSYQHCLTHISSVLNVVNVLEEIYEKRKDDEPVVLGPSHAALGLYVVLESVGLCDAEEMIKKHGTHAGRDPDNGIWCSGGSLGQAETIAVGMALADRSRNVWLITSDGACAEGCVWEALAFADKLKLTNLDVTVIANGLAGYGEVDVDLLKMRLSCFKLKFTVVQPPKFKWPWMQGLSGHYTTINKEQCEEMLR